MKDYYAILGIIPSAEDVVIRAAWKALVQRYHPDRFTGRDVAKVNMRMAEINEAYSVFSDPVQRKAYDKLRGSKGGNFGDWMHEEDAGQTANSSNLEKDWALAVEFYPDLVEINNRLSKISQLLALSYRASLLERKAFEKREKLSELAEKSFLQPYFGTNPEIVDFAKVLIFEGNKTAAKALNSAIQVLGSDITPDMIIKKISKDFNVETREMKRERFSRELDAKYAAQRMDAVASINYPVLPNQSGHLNLLRWGAAIIVVFVVGANIFNKNEPPQSMAIVDIPAGSFDFDMSSNNGEQMKDPYTGLPSPTTMKMENLKSQRSNGKQFLAKITRASVMGNSSQKALQDKI